jgi:glutamate-1-semialdehyde 2,1-aminomutase
MLSIDAALQEAYEFFRSKRPKTAAFHERAKAVMPGGNTRTILYSAPFPIRVEYAEGSIIRDIDGHQYIDLVGEYSAGIYGHSHPRIHKAVRDALAMGLNMGAQHVREVEFAEIVAERFNVDLIRFTNSGTEANMMALAAARCFTKRRKIMPMYGGYHGGTLYFSHGGSPVNAPYEAVVGRFNDVAATRELIARHADDLAAVMLEPMMGSGGCIPADKPFLEMLREECTKRGIVLIYDEVMTSRLTPNGLTARYGIVPDLKTFGKYIGGGMSFGAFGGRKDIMDQFDPARPGALPHAGTFNNNTLTMTAGFAAMTEVFTPEACISLNARGDRLRDALSDLFMRYQAPMRATGLGSMIAVHPVGGEIKKPEDVEKADVRLRQLFYFDLLEDGFYFAERGFIALSLMITDDQNAKLVDAVEGFIKRRRELLQPRVAA